MEFCCRVSREVMKEDFELSYQGFSLSFSGCVFLLVVLIVFFPAVLRQEV